MASPCVGPAQGVRGNLHRPEGGDAWHGVMHGPDGQLNRTLERVAGSAAWPTERRYPVTLTAELEGVLLGR
jgi:hypothetical protein